MSKTEAEVLRTIHIVARDALDPRNVNPNRPHKRSTQEAHHYALHAILNQTIDYAQKNDRA